MIAYVLWSNSEFQKEQAKLHPTPPAIEAQASPAPTVAPAPAPKEEPLPATISAAPVTTVPEEKAMAGTKTVEYAFTNLGGGISSLKLLTHKGAKPGENIVLNTSATHPIGALLRDIESKDNDSYEVKVKDDSQVVFEKTVPPGVLVRKVYTLNQEPKGAYHVDLEVTFSNKSATAIDYPDYYVYTGAAAPLHADDLPIYVGFDWFNGNANSFIKPNWCDPSRIPLIGTETSPGKSVYSETPGGVVWAGVRDQYFTTMLLPDGTAKGVRAHPLTLKMDSKEIKGIEGYLEMPGFNLQPGKDVSKKFTIYTGPAEYNQLAALDRGAVEMMNLDRWWITRTVGMLLLRSMNWLEGILHSYAWAIIVLTFIVRGALWPIQGRANKSMKRMQLLQPKMTELKEKYKDDPSKMNQEVMKLYKEYGANPLSGCLPMFIQIPIFIGFYSMLGTAVELRNQGFLWVHDLARPDTIAFLAGIPVNILPLLMAGTMVCQMQLTPKAGDPAQQKMMMFMPLIFVVFTYNFASALALYYTVQNVLSIIQLYVNRNQPMPQLVKASAGNKKNRR